jgi:hypothetical protein
LVAHLHALPIDHHPGSLIFAWPGQFIYAGLADTDDKLPEREGYEYCLSLAASFPE